MRLLSERLYLTGKSGKDGRLSVGHDDQYLYMENRPEGPRASEIQMWDVKLDKSLLIEAIAACPVVRQQIRQESTGSSSQLSLLPLQRLIGGKVTRAQSASSPRSDELLHPEVAPHPTQHEHAGACR
jgi:hypothetical protein